jgi:hypothetical protein
MTAEKIRIRMDGVDILTFDNCAREEPTTFNISSSAHAPVSTDTQVTEGVRKVVSEYGEALKKLSNE